MNDSFLFAARRRASVFLFLGWFLTVVNVLGILWALWLPLDLYAWQKQWSFLFFERTFFFLDERVPHALWSSLAVLAFAVFALLQILFLPRVAARMVDDIPETAAAEAALRLAGYVAYVTILVSLISFVYDIKTFRFWAGLYKLELEL